jgi:hypothetical protein
MPTGYLIEKGSRIATLIANIDREPFKLTGVIETDHYLIEDLLNMANAVRHEIVNWRISGEPGPSSVIVSSDQYDKRRQDAEIDALLDRLEHLTGEKWEPVGVDGRDLDGQIPTLEPITVFPIEVGPDGFPVDDHDHECDAFCDRRGQGR